MRKFLGVGAACVVLVLGTGCTTTGIGYGGVGRSGGPVAFKWKSGDAVSGAMSAMLPNGESFAGHFFQITQQTSRNVLAPLWNGWHDGWYDWPYWGPVPATEFVTRYSGKVVANLEGPSGKRMRCRFHLADPVSGMAGGGQGECQMSDGRTIDATFPPA